jgi:hypothetical protein
MRRKTSAPLLVGDILKEAMKRRNIPVDVGSGKIVSDWENTVGPVISQQTRPEKIKNRTLYLTVSSPIWMQQLQFMKKELLEKVNAALQKDVVSDIFFNVGVIEHQPAAPKKQDFRLDESSFPLKPRDKRLIKETLSRVKDPELGRVIERAMKKGIIRRKMIDEGKAR